MAKHHSDTESDGRLLAGDQILAINGQDVTNSLQEEVAAILKTCCGKVVLRVGRWKLTDTLQEDGKSNRKSKSSKSSGSAKSTPSPSSQGVSEKVPLAIKPQSPIIDEKKEEEPAVEKPSSPQQEPSAEGQPSTSESTLEEHKNSLTRTAEEIVRAGPSTAEIKLIKDLYEEGSESILVELNKQPNQTLGEILTFLYRYNDFS